MTSIKAINHQSPDYVSVTDRRIAHIKTLQFYQSCEPFLLAHVTSPLEVSAAEARRLMREMVARGDLVELSGREWIQPQRLRETLNRLWKPTRSFDNDCDQLCI